LPMVRASHRQQNTGILRDAQNDNSFLVDSNSESIDAPLQQK